MTFTARTYPDIVADVLTAVTQGVVAEAVAVPGELPDDHLFFLTSRPIRRISRVDGVRLDADGAEQPWRFTDADWEVVASTGRPDELDALRFRPRRPRPAPGSMINVSYWPSETPPLPLTDLSIGSVTRTLLETLARELADAEAQLQIVYDSAFVDTATGRSLDRVVALLGMTRFGADTARGKVRLHRKSGSAGQVTVPVGTEVLTGDGAKYTTTREVVLQRGETSVEVAVAASTRSTPLVEAGTLDRLAHAVAGIDRIGNDAPTYRATAAEADVELRARAKRAFHGVGRGTLDALKHGIAGLDVVKAVEVTEFPDGQAGVVKLDIAYVEPGNAEHVALVEAAIAELKPAGIRIERAAAAALDVGIDITTLVFTGATRPTDEIETIRTALGARLSDAIGGLAPGGRLSASRVAALALADDAIADIDVRFTVGGEADRSEISLPPSTTAQPITPLSFPTVTFADQATGPPSRLEVSIIAPLQLIGQTRVAEAEHLIRAGVERWLADVTELAFDDFATAVRNDDRYGLVAEDAAVVLESDGRFEQLVLGSPTRPLAEGERVVLGSIDVEEVS